MTDLNGLFSADGSGEFASQARYDAQAASRRGEDLLVVADNVSARAAERLAAIRSDSRLNDDAKAEDIARITAERNARVAALGAVYEAELRSELDRLQRRLSQPPPAMIGAETIARDASFRDALERARRTEDRAGGRHALMGLLHSARLTGDALQERAAMVVALERNDVDVMNGWLEDHPEDDDALQKLYDVHHRVNDRKAKFGRAMQFVRV